MKLALETGLSLKTVEKWCRGGRCGVNEATDRVLLRAMSELGIKPENEVPHDEK